MDLQILHLTKYYGKQKAVDNLFFHILSGETVGFLGPNGAGKSTTLKIILGYTPPSEGTVKLGNFNLEKDSLAIRRHIGYLAESNPLYTDMYVREMLQFTGKLYGLKSKLLTERINLLIEMTGLAPEQHKKIEALSKGYRKRVGLAAALIHDPDVLILDEPTDGLDVFQVTEIRNLIASFSGKKTILFSSHILSEVEALASRVIILNRGIILADRNIKELIKSVESEQIIRFETEKPGFDCRNLEKTKGVKSIEPLTATAFIVRAEPSAEIRKAVYDLSVGQNNPLVTLSKDEMNLEDLFKTVTRQN